MRPDKPHPIGTLITARNKDGIWEITNYHWNDVWGEWAVMVKQPTDEAKGKLQWILQRDILDVFYTI